MNLAIDSPTQILVDLARIRRALDDTADIRELKSLRDEAESARHHAKIVALGLETQNQAAEVRLMVERRIGGLLHRLHLHGGDRRSSDRHHGMSLDELGISRSQSAQWQIEASLPEEAFQEYLSKTQMEGKELTSKGLVRLARLHAGATSPANDGENQGTVRYCGLRRKGSCLELRSRVVETHPASPFQESRRRWRGRRPTDTRRSCRRRQRVGVSGVDGRPCRYD